MGAYQERRGLDTPHERAKNYIGSRSGDLKKEVDKRKVSNEGVREDKRNSEKQSVSW